MFKLWKKNNNKETTVKTKSKRKVAVLAFAAAALACLTGASLMFGLNAANNRGGFGGMSGIDGIHNTGSLAGAAIPTTADKPTYDYEIHLKGTAPEMATLWKEAVGLSGKVLVVLENNWTADATTGFGSDTGFTDNNGLDIPAGKNITIDLNGKKLDRNSAAAVTSSVIRVPAGATLTVNDASNGGQITGGNTATYGGGIHVNGGTLTLNGGTITGNKAGSTKNGEPVGLGVAVRSSGTFTMNGGKITANTCESSLSIGGGGVSVNTGALFVMNGGEISDHDVVWGVGINVLNGSTLIMNGGVVKNNTANGGAIVNVSGGTVDGTSSGAAANSTFIMNGGTFTDNTVHNIGCIGVSGRASFTMNGGKITKTTNTIGAGDAIYAAGSSTSSKDASVVINGGEISYNTCVSGAGGIYVGGNGGAVLSINGGLICHNEGADGGGVAVGRYSDFYMYGGTISENSVSHEGGGICLITKNDTGVAFAGGSVINNTSVAGGGGIYVPANLEMNIRGGLVVTGNTSGAVGSKITQNVYLSGASALFKTRGYIDSYGSAPQIGITYNGSVPYNFIMDITTAASHYNDGNFIGAYFFSDDPNRVVSEEGGNNYPKLMAVGSSKVTTLTWEYQLDNSEWVTVPANQGIVRRPYDGKTVTAVRYTMNVSGITYGNGTYTIDATGATTTASRYGSYAQKPLFYVTGCDHLGEERYHTNGEIDYSSGKNGTPVFEGLKNVGSYGFSANEGDLGYFYSLYTTNGSLTIQIVPQDVTVTIDDKSITYGDTPATLTSDAPADAGVTLTKLGGVGVGKHTILGTVDKSVATSKNYNITFKNQGVYEITQRAVTVIVNNAEAEYGEKKYTLNKDENKTAVKGTLPLSDDGSKDADGFDVDTDGDRVDSNGNKIYNGGWRYAGDSATDTGKQFIAADVNKTKHEYPIELSCSAVETESATYIAVDDYDIIAKSVNPNYNLTILNADGTPAASGNGKGTFSVTEATIKVMKGSEYKTLKGGDAKAYDSEVYKGNNVTVSIPTASFTGTDTKTYPTGAVILKGDGAVSGIIYRIFNSDGKNVTTPSVTKPTETPAADDATFWGSSDTTVTDADTYTVYAKISATHHEDLVYVFTYELTGQKTKLTLIAKWGTNNVATNVTDNSVTVDASKAVYDGTTKLTLDKTYVNTDANSTNCPLLVYYKNTAPKSDTDTAWKWGAWTSTLTRLETTDTTSPKYKYSADKKFHEDYGTTEEPKDGGTYTVTVLVDPDSKGFTIDGLNSLTVTVNAKEVDIPKGPTTNPVYNGTEWEAFSLSYNTAGVNPKSWASNEGYEDLTKGTTTAGTPNTTQKYKATNAGKYAVIFELTNKDNYKWKDKTGNEATADQKVELTLDKKAVTVTFNPPKEDASMKWTWKPGDYTDKYITYTIDESSLCADPDDSTKKEAVTVNLLMCKQPKDGEAAEPISTYIVDATETELAKINVTSIGTGKYFVYATLVSDSENAVNKNYVIEVDETSGLPKNVKQAFTVDNGEVSLSGLSWLYTYTKDGTTPDPVAYEEGKLTYSLNKDGSKVTYTLTLDTDTQNGFPEYLDASKITYDGNEKTDAGEHTITVTLYIVDNSDYKFKSDSEEYDYVSDTKATLTFKWKIEKADVDLSKLEWSYKVDGGDETVKFNAPTEEGVYEVDVQDGLTITPVLTGGYDDKVVEINEYDGDGTATGAPVFDVTADGDTLKTTVTFKLLDSNFNQPDPVEFEWRVTIATLDITGWSPTGTVKDKNGVPYTTPVVTGGDENLADKVKYVYTYNGKDYEGVEGLKELYKLADDEDKQLTGVTVKVLPIDEDSYRLDDSKGENFFIKTGATIGEAGIRLTVDLSATSGTYSEAELEVKVNNKSTGKEAPTAVYTVYVYETDKDGEIVEDSKKALSDVSVKDLNSGVYVIAVETKTGYVVAAGQNYLKYTVNKKALDLPTLAENPVFNGTNLEIEKLLTGLDKSLMTVSGQGSAGNGVRNVQDNAYTLTITLTEEAAKNYVWKEADDKTASKHVLAEIAAPETRMVSETEVKIDWHIAPFVLAVTDKDWNLSGKTPVLNISGLLPAGADIDVGVGYSYYANESDKDPQDVELKSGSSVWVAAYLTGADAQIDENGEGHRNVILVNDAPTTSKVSFTAPKSGMKAAMGSAMDFVKSNWLWFAIGLGILILLIILIIIIAVARKNKEKRLEKKAAKEEEKQRKEEERQRKEEERRLKEEQREEEKRRREAEREAAKAKQEAELELARAKQEAELAKIKAEVAAMAGPAVAATAAMAAQQQPQQQPVPQQQPQPQPQMQQQQPMPQMQQPQYQQYLQQMPMPMQMAMNNGGISTADIERIMAKLETEFAKLRADQTAGYAPAQSAPAQPAPVQSNGGGIDLSTYMLMHLESEIQQLKNGNNNQQQPMMYMPANGAQTNNAADGSSSAVAAAVAAALAAVNAQTQKSEKEERKVADTEANNASTVYPAAAVITTTTMVDTTNHTAKGQQADVARSIKRDRQNSKLPERKDTYDADGFYDTFDEGK